MGRLRKPLNILIISPGQQLESWLREEADPRVHGTHRQRVIDRFEAERGQLSPLPRVRFDTAYREQRFVAWDGYIEVRGNRYSVPAAYCGQPVTVWIGLDHSLRVVDGEDRCVAHADPIVGRHRERLRAGDDPEILWKNREQAFPCLIFSPGVEENLNEIQPRQFHTVVNKLVALNQTAMIWREGTGVDPPWGTKVTPETKRVIKNNNLRDARMFMSHDGTRKNW